MEGQFLIILLGILLLVFGMFFARPYCRIFCPYGVLLGWMSRFSWKHMSITPAECIQCKLCANSCPFDAIDYPTSEKERAGISSRSSVRRFLLYLLLIPVWVAAGGFIGSRAHVYLSKAHQDVYLAELLIAHPELKSDIKNIDIQTFLESGKSMDELVEGAKAVRKKFHTG